MKIAIGIFLVLIGIALFILMIVLSGDAEFLFNWSKK